MFFHDFPHLFHDLFLHRFLMRAYIVFGSILAYLWHQISCFSEIVVLLVSCMVFVYVFGQKWSQIGPFGWCRALVFVPFFVSLPPLVAGSSCRPPRGHFNMFWHDSGTLLALICILFGD